jgi:hypothetical protein
MTIQERPQSGDDRDAEPALADRAAAAARAELGGDRGKILGAIGMAALAPLTLNEMRDALGLDPYAEPAADRPMVLTATDYGPSTATDYGPSTATDYGPSIVK